MCLAIYKILQKDHERHGKTIYHEGGGGFYTFLINTIGPLLIRKIVEK